jgi:predicted O-methyltransferase YrrM
MKGSPSYPEGVPGVWKVELLRWLADTQHINYMIETGTCEGSSCVALSNSFMYIYTVELHDGLYEHARQRFEDLYIRNVGQFKGSSKERLPEMLRACPPGPVLIFLDAHSSGPHTADDGNPLPTEIRAIVTTRRHAIIVVDDMHSLEDFFAAAEISAESLEVLGWKVEYRTGEVIIYQPSLYTIPPFEDA